MTGTMMIGKRATGRISGVVGRDWELTISVSSWVGGLIGQLIRVLVWPYLTLNNDEHNE